MSDLIYSELILSDLTSFDTIRYVRFSQVFKQHILRTIDIISLKAERTRLRGRKNRKERNGGKKMRRRKREENVSKDGQQRVWNTVTHLLTMH